MGKINWELKSNHEMPINCWNDKKNKNFRETMKFFGLRSSENNSEKTIVRNLFDVYQEIGSTSCSKDANVTQHVLKSTIMSKKNKNPCLISKPSVIKDK